LNFCICKIILSRESEAGINFGRRGGGFSDLQPMVAKSRVALTQADDDADLCPTQEHEA
jgi:hypothetical protein